MNRARPVKALQVVDTLGMGGAETWLMEVLRHWARTGAGMMDFLATSGNTGGFDAEARRLGATIHYVPYGRRHVLRFANEFRRILREGSFDAIHDHQDCASGWHFLFGGSALPPVRVTHVHTAAYVIRSNYGVTRTRRLTARIGERLIARYATHICGTSRQVIGECGFDAPRYHHTQRAALHCAFDPSRFAGDAGAAKVALCAELGWPPDARITLVAGRLDRSPDFDHPQNQKNTGLAVAIGIECARRDPRSHMLFAGAPSVALPALRQRIADAGCVGQIEFLGIRGDIERLMLGSDVLLFPSRGEGLGMVAVEAQAAGLPVLASTAVPRECVVVPDLVRFQEVREGVSAWATSVLELAGHRREVRAPNEQVAASAYAIGNSSRALLRLYRDGLLG